jgi:mannosyl-3-phosphoglycerate phosphatase
VSGAGVTTPARPTLVIFSDLDGCLLDATTYEFEPARPALREIERAGVPLVLCSSKTRPEMEVLAARLGLCAPFVVENGGAIVVPDGSRYGGVPGAVPDNGARVARLGVERSILVQALREIGAETGLELRGFSQMTASEAAAWTGLPRHAAVFALRRQYDEPFVVMGEKGRAAELAAGAERRGFVVTRGGRFFHLSGRVDKGLAVRVLASCFGTGDRPCRSVALGDAENDLSMLLAVDVPILVPRPDSSVDERLAQALPGARIAPAPGPVGWNAAVLEVLRGERTARAPAGASR